MADTIVLFGGTSEGRILAEAAMQHYECHVFVATESGAEFLPEDVRKQDYVHIGRLDADQMAETFRSLQPAFVMDATHPYAVEVTQNIRKACEREGVRYLRVLRESLAVQECIMAESAEDAERILLKQFRGCPVLLTTGSKELPLFSGLLYENPKVYARILPGEANEAIALQSGVLPEHLLTGIGPFSEEENYAVLHRYGIRVLVTKESGNRGGFSEKISAAKKAGAGVIVIKRPAEEEGITLQEALQILNMRTVE